MVLRGSQLKPTESVTEQYADLQEAKASVEDAHRSLEEFTERSLQTLKKRPSATSHNATLSQHETKELVATITTLRERVHELEAEKSAAHDAYAKSQSEFKRTLRQLACGGGASFFLT